MGKINFDRVTGISAVAWNQIRHYLKLLDDRLEAAEDEFHITVPMSDATADQSTWVVVPKTGNLVDAWAVLNSDLPGESSVITVRKGGVVASTFDLTFLALAEAGTVVSANPGPTTKFEKGQAVEMVSDMGSAGSLDCTVTLLFRKA